MKTVRTVLPATTTYTVVAGGGGVESPKFWWQMALMLLGCVDGGDYWARVGKVRMFGWQLVAVVYV